MIRSFADGRLMGELVGDAPPRVLALHGWGRTRRDLVGVLGPADEELSAVVLDLPGFGASPPPAEAWGSAEYAELVAQVFGDMATPVVILAHSFGGRIAVRLAASHPEAVAALVLTGVPLLRSAKSRRPPLSFRAARSAHGIGILSDARMERFRQRYGSTDYRAAEGVMRGVLVRLVNEDYTDTLKSIHCPVTLVWGDDDDVAPTALAEQVVGVFEDGRLELISGAGHLTPLTAPDHLLAAVLERLAPRPAG
ncbi:MAG: alpha/beta fold hydrolase [Acidimicrobiales bacterium]